MILLRALTALAAPAGARRRLSVFYFHRVLEKPDALLPFEPDARMFERMLRWIGAQFRVLDPLEACDRLYDGSLPSRSALISFDDGYRDNCTMALPILQRNRMQAVFFVATGFLDGGMMFNDRVIEAIRHASSDHVTLPDAPPGRSAALPLGSVEQRRVAIDAVLAAVKHLPPEQRAARVEALEREAGEERRRSTPMMMDPQQVLHLHRQGMRIGGHTRTHPILVKLDDDEALAEIEGGLSDLAAIAGERPSLFAYPNGRRGSDYDARHAGMLEGRGVRYAFTTHPGAATPQSPRYELPRFTPWDRTPVKFGARSLWNLTRQPA